MSYYEENKETILKKAKERYLRKKLIKQDETIKDEIKKLNKKIISLQEKVEYFKNKAIQYRKERTQKNNIIKELQEKLNNSVPKQTGTKYNKTIEIIKKLESLINDKQQPKILYEARIKQLNKLKESVGLPIYITLNQ